MDSLFVPESVKSVYPYKLQNSRVSIVGFGRLSLLRIGAECLSLQAYVSRTIPMEFVLVWIIISG